MVRQNRNKSLSIFVLLLVFVLSLFPHLAYSASVATYNHTGGQQTYTVPSDVNRIKIETWGAQGGGYTQEYGGKGGYAEGYLNVTPGETLYVYVGGEGGSGSSADGGYNGGGDGSGYQGAGGGASDVRYGGTSLYDRIIVAGGGGGAVGYHSGGKTGSNGGGTSGSGSGGTQTTGGNPGGSFGSGGSRGQSSGSSYPGGGGGYYGGGYGRQYYLGSSTWILIPGGGGSGYIGGVENGSMSSGAKTGNGKVVITPAPVAPNTPTGNTTGLSWQTTEGRGRIQLSWPAVVGATGYKVWVYDGNTYRSFDVGNKTSWDSFGWKIYPSESQLDGYGDNSQSGNLFNTVKGGLDLRDDPNKLYIKTVGTTYDNRHNYWFRVSAYNSYGEESAKSGAYQPTLPNRTDNTAPAGSVSINDGANYTNSTNVTINLSNMYDPAVSNYTTTTSDDASGLYQKRFSNDGSSWSSWESFSNSKSWTVPGGSGTKTVYVQVKDLAGNISSTKTDTIYLDNVAPTGSISINGGATYTTSTNITLNLSADDNASGVGQMRFMYDGGSWSSWVGYSTSHNFTINSTNGSLTISVQFRDNAGNISGTYSDTIVLDTAAPSGTVVINSGDTFTNNRPVSLAITSNDATSGTSYMQVSNYSNFSGASWEPISGSKSLNLSSGDGTKTIYIRFRDNAGNISGTFSDTIVLDTVTPTGTIEVTTEDGLSKTADTSVVLTLTGSDDRSGLAGIQLSNNGTSWTELEALSSPRDWELSTGAGTKTVYLKLIDNAGNEYITTGEIYLVDDVTGPIVSMVINGGDSHTMTNLVDLIIGAYDNFSTANELQMRFSNDGQLWSSWEPYSYTKTGWDITNSSYGGTSDQELKSVYVQLLDDAQNTGLARADINYSTSEPTGDISTSEGVSGTYQGENVKFVDDTKTAVTLNYPDAAEMRYSVDGVSFSPWKAYNNTLNLNLPKGDGLSLVAVQVKDQYGAVSQVDEYKFVVDRTAPEVTVKTTYSVTATTTGDVDLTVYAKDTVTKPGDFQYRVNGSSWQTLPADCRITVLGLSFGQRHNVIIEIRDQAGNISSDSVNIWSIQPAA